MRGLFLNYATIYTCIATELCHLPEGILSHHQVETFLMSSTPVIEVNSFWSFIFTWLIGPNNSEAIVCFWSKVLPCVIKIFLYLLVVVQPLIQNRFCKLFSLYYSNIPFLQDIFTAFHKYPECLLYVKVYFLDAELLSFYFTLYSPNQGLNCLKSNYTNWIYSCVNYNSCFFIHSKNRTVVCLIFWSHFNAAKVFFPHIYAFLKSHS